MATLMQAHRTMPSRWRSFIEDKLPWYHTAHERQRNVNTERIRLRSIAARILAERVERAIDEYRAADGRK